MLLLLKKTINIQCSYLMLKTDRNVKCVRSHLQPAVPTPELQILDLQVLVASLLFWWLMSPLKSWNLHWKPSVFLAWRILQKRPSWVPLEGYSERKIVIRKDSRDVITHQNQHTEGKFSLQLAIARGCKTSPLYDHALAIVFTKLGYGH